VALDFGKTSSDYARHRQGFPPALFDELDRFAIGRPGQRIVDLGTGTGTMARGFARRGAQVTGVDRAANMVEAAAKLAAEEGLAIQWRAAPAEATGLPGAAFDVVSAGQCWHWFDRPKAMAETKRLLRPGGKVAIAHMDWLASGQNVAATTEEILNRYNPDAPNVLYVLGGGVAIYRDWLRELAEGGFTDLRSFSFDVVLSYTHEAWRGRARASQWVGAMLSPEKIERFDREFERVLAEKHPEEPLRILHRVFAVVGTRGE
jgi:ubiquinone/menaquinone biosynthesis C-methylase UbiE